MDLCTLFIYDIVIVMWDSVYIISISINNLLKNVSEINKIFRIP